MRERRTGIIMNGVTGRMGLNQHLIRSVLAIRNQGGLPLSDGSTLMPDPILVGRNEDKLKAIASAHGLSRWTTDLAVSGSMLWNQISGVIRAELQFKADDGTTGTLSAVWNDQQSQLSAQLTGTVAGQAVVASMPAP